MEEAKWEAWENEKEFSTIGFSTDGTQGNNQKNCLTFHCPNGIKAHVTEDFVCIVFRGEWEAESVRELFEKAGIQSKKHDEKEST